MTTFTLPYHEDDMTWFGISPGDELTFDTDITRNTHSVCAVMIGNRECVLRCVEYTQGLVNLYRRQERMQPVGKQYLTGEVTIQGKLVAVNGKPFTTVWSV